MENYENLENNLTIAPNLALPLPSNLPPPPPPPPPESLSPLQPNEGVQFVGNYFPPPPTPQQIQKHIKQQKVIQKSICLNNNINTNLIRKNVSMLRPGQQLNTQQQKKTAITRQPENPNRTFEKGGGGQEVVGDEDLESPQLSVQAETINEFYECKSVIDPSEKIKGDDGKCEVNQTVLNQYKSIRSTMNFVFDFMANPTKNRFTNVMMFNEGNCFVRDVENVEEKYYHANKVSTEQGTYIMAQAPLKNTVKTFWNMIWEQGVCIIASFSDYSNREECYPYFELSCNKKIKIGCYVIQTEERKTSTPAIIFKLKVYNKKTKQGRIVNIINWIGWDVHHIPSMTKLLAMMSLVWKMEHLVEVIDKREIGPILVHGVSGSRRTATFVAINILCKQLRDTKKCSVITTAVLIRRYRHNAIRDHLMFANILLAIMHYAASLNQVNKKDPRFIKASKAIIAFVSSNKIVQKAIDIKGKQEHESREKIEKP